MILDAETVLVSVAPPSGEKEEQAVMSLQGCFQTLDMYNSWMEGRLS